MSEGIEKKSLEVTDDVPQTTAEEQKRLDFEANPDRFQDLAEVVLMIKRDKSSGHLMALNQALSTEEAYIAIGYLQQSVQDAVLRGRVKQHQEREKLLAKNKGGFLNQIRGLKR